MRNSDLNRPMPQPDGTPGRAPFILASASPRRHELVARFWPGAQLQIQVPCLDEATLIAGWQDSMDPDQLIQAVSRAKWQALRHEKQLPETCLILTADTVVVTDRQIMGKPVDRQDACRMLQSLSGRDHQVLTGLFLEVCLDGQSLTIQAVESTDVWFGQISREQIDWYLDSGEPFDKAGAYGIQGLAAAFVERVSGCYYNVMGLPVFRLMALLQQARDHFQLNSGSTQFPWLPWN